MPYLVDDFKENETDYGSQDSLDAVEQGFKNVNCLRTITSTKMTEYLGARDETNTRRFPAVTFSRCPKDLSMDSLPGLYNIVSMNFRQNDVFSDGRVFFACPASREKFLADWANKYARVFPDVQVNALETFVRSSWTLPIKRFTFPDKFPYPLFHQLNYCFADAPAGDLKNYEVTIINKESWLFECGGPHFFLFADKTRRDEIEATILADSPCSTLERPCMGSCVTVKTEKYPAARGVIYSRRLNFANIFLVDYGISEEFPDSALTSINKSIMELPFLAVPCKLALRESIEIVKLENLFTLAKADAKIEVRRISYRGAFNMIDVFKCEKSVLNETLGLTKATRQIPCRVYSREQVTKWQSLTRSKFFVNPLDHLTTLEWNTMYKKSKPANVN